MTTSSADYGRQYRNRRALLPEPQGDPCPRCGLPMWPGMALDSGHSVDRVRGGANSALRWEHRKCNRAAGARLGNARRGMVRANRRRYA